MAKLFKKSGDAKSRVVITIDTDKLMQLKKMMSTKVVVKVGVLGSKLSRSGKGEFNNAEIGLVHEKGSLSRGIPRRSFLEVPLTNGLVAEKKKIVKMVNDSVEAGEVELFYQKLGVLAEGIVLSSFASQGHFGEWLPVKGRRGTPLIDTGQLRKSVTHEVKKST